MGSKVIKRFGIVIFLWTLLMLATLRLSFHFITITPNINSTSTATFHSNNNTIPSVTTIPSSITTIWDIEQCWSYLFITQFVEPKLSHQFTNPNTFSPKTDSLLSICNPKNIPLLLTQTYTTLKSTRSIHKFTFHDLISLRRTLMILSHKSNIKNISSHPKYSHILTLISKMESKYISQKRYKYPIFNIHLPRSAGTTMCYQFQLSQWYQSTNTIQFPNGSYTYTLKTHPIDSPIITNPKQGTNCNIGDGFPFPQYLINSHAPKTCTEQYIQSQNYTMFARESPMYNNKNNNIFHPLLCNKYIYVLTVRSPIERILSWIAIDGRLEPTGNSNLTVDDYGYIDFKDVVTGFFDSIFDYNINKPKQNPFYEIIEIKNSTKIKVNNQWIRGYANNALTRWIGYEFSESDLINNELMKGLLTHEYVINKNDFHFYNAVKLMMKIDYVLNFASYGRDESTRSAIINGIGKENMDVFWIRNVMENHTKIQDTLNDDNIWNVFAEHMNRRFKSNVFDWNRDVMKKLKPKKNELFDLLTKEDWKVLYEQNYFDYRLYSLSKVIGEMDVEFYKMYDGNF